MRTIGWKFFAALSATLGLGLVGMVDAQEGHDHGTASHGGTVVAH
jgi:hypothetical protein